MKINKFFQNYFKKIFHNLFFLIYGRVKEYEEIHKVDFKVDKIKNIIIDNQSYNIKNSIYEINKGRIYTDLVEHVAIIKNNVILPEISYQQINGELKKEKFNKVLYTGTPRLIKNYNGTVLSLVQGASGDNYFHFLFDIVTKLKLCEEIISLKDIDFFYVPNDFEWQKNIFSNFNIDINKLINSKLHRHIKAKKIIAIDHPWYTKGFIHNEVQNIPEWIIFWLREKFLKVSKKFNCSEKIFIDRSESKFNHCKLINNDEIIKFLTNKDFKSYQVGKLDFFEQIYLFNNAKIIIGPHGAAFANTVFSKPKSTLIEIIPEDHPNKKTQRISEILNINYIRLRKPKLQYTNNLEGDMKVDIGELENILKKINSD